MRNVWAVAVVLLLAGCAGQAADGGADQTQSDPTVRTGVGAILGVVVDDAVRPLADANVTATGPSGPLNATSDAEGRFRFDGLAAGVYLVEVSKPFYISHQQAVTVVESVEPQTTRFLLTFEAGTVPYANLYKVEGFYECGSHPYHLCANVNIATWIVVCANTGGLVCPGNVTQDSSLFFQMVEPGLDFLQGELVWTPTTSTGEQLALLLGGGNEEELKAGMAPAYNATDGPSPLMLRISNHEAPDAWCFEAETCTRSDVLNETGIGTERALLVQVATGPTVSVDPLCGIAPPPAPSPPCATGFAAQQPFTMFTIAFYGYEPPADWLFSATGELPPAPT
jgi:hypothetical protein